MYYQFKLLGHVVNILVIMVLNFFDYYLVISTNVDGFTIIRQQHTLHNIDILCFRLVHYLNVLRIEYSTIVR